MAHPHPREGPPLLEIAFGFSNVCQHDNVNAAQQQSAVIYVNLICLANN